MGSYIELFVYPDIQLPDVTLMGSGIRSWHSSYNIAATFINLGTYQRGNKIIKLFEFIYQY
jgi:hypothetical protein